MAESTKPTISASEVYSELRGWEGDPWLQSSTIGKTRSGNLAPSQVGKLLASIADDASALAAVWNALVRKLVSGHLHSPYTEIQKLCKEYELSPEPNAPHFFRLRALSDQLLTKPGMASVLDLSRLKALLDALDDLYWKRDIVAELADAIIRAGLTSENRTDWDLLLRDLSHQVELLERQAAHLHALAAEVELMSDNQSVISINTGGGTYIAGNVSSGNDFIGRDKSEGKTVN